VIGWLPDLAKWAQMIISKLKPGATFYMVEFHPIAWMFNYQTSPPTMDYHYSKADVIYEEYSGTYAAPQSQIISREYTWNHALSDVLQSLIDAGLKIQLFDEHDGSPYNVFPNMVRKNDLFYLEDQKHPLIFELKAVLPVSG
jgi:hypothetical protein